MSIATRFFSKVQLSKTGCWEWQGYKNPAGYGKLADGAGSNMLAHRVAYLLFNNDLPDGVLVCHRCDNPACVNPDHLFLGTHQDNTDDMFSKGRGNKASGAENGRAKMNDASVEELRELRANGMPLKLLAERFNISVSQASKIARGDFWK